jgi:hypothetical protein
MNLKKSNNIIIKTMKKSILITVIILLAFSMNAQKWDWKRSTGIIGYHLATVAVGALGDATFDNGNKDLGHALKATEVGMLIGGPFLFKIELNEAVPYISTYVFLRFATFDGIYNVSRDLPVLYQGNTSGYDKFMSKVPPHGRAWWKCHALVVGIAIPIKNL